MTCFLDDIQPIDWNDFGSAAETSQHIVRQLADDRALIGRLLDGIEEDSSLFLMCEKHDVLDKLVLYDALDRGFRIRIHISSGNPAERIHEHRFSFTSLILRGEYEHIFYGMTGGPDLETASFHKVHVTTERAGSCYTMHDSVFHTTYMPAGMVSLILRGDSVKERAVIVDPKINRVWWRYTDSQESEEHRRSVRMTPEYLRGLCAQLREWGLAI